MVDAFEGDETVVLVINFKVVGNAFFSRTETLACTYFLYTSFIWLSMWHFWGG